MRLTKLECYPNREIRVSTVRSRSPRRFVYEEKEVAVGEGESPDSSYLTFVQNSKSSRKRHPEPVLEIEGKPGWGGLPRIQRFSTYARRTILRAGGALECVAPANECLFLTLTLPGSTRESFEALARYSAFAVQRLKAWLGKYISNNLSLYTWELQKRGALHLHYVVWCPDRQRGEWIQANVKTQWTRILDAIARQSGVDVYKKGKGFTWANDKEVLQVDSCWCEKSVAAYISKYVSKGQAQDSASAKFLYHPSRWYGVSRPLLAELRRQSHCLKLDSQRDSEAWATYEDCLSLLKSTALKCYDYRHQVGDGKTIVAYVNKNEQESIWQTIMTQTIITPDSFENHRDKLLRYIQNGVCLMRKHKAWSQTWKQFCANSRPDNLLMSPLCRDTSPADLVYLLDSLIYTYRYVGRVRFELPKECSLWFTQTTEYLHRIDADGSLGLRAVIPHKVLLRLDQEKLTGIPPSLRWQGQANEPEGTVSPCPSDEAVISPPLQYELRF